MRCGAEASHASCRLHSLVCLHRRACCRLVDVCKRRGRRVYADYCRTYILPSCGVRQAETALRLSLRIDKLAAVIGRFSAADVRRAGYLNKQEFTAFVQANWRDARSPQAAAQGGRRGASGGGRSRPAADATAVTVAAPSAGNPMSAASDAALQLVSPSLPAIDALFECVDALAGVDPRALLSYKDVVRSLAIVAYGVCQFEGTHHAHPPAATPAAASAAGAAASSDVSITVAPHSAGAAALPAPTITIGGALPSVRAPAQADASAIALQARLVASVLAVACAAGDAAAVPAAGPSIDIDALAALMVDAQAAVAAAEQRRGGGSDTGIASATPTPAAVPSTTTPAQQAPAAQPVTTVASELRTVLSVAADGHAVPVEAVSSLLAAAGTQLSDSVRRAGKEAWWRMWGLSP